MKEKLKKIFNPIYWAQTREMRAKDMKRKLPLVTLKSQWPGLFQPEGVFFASSLNT